MSSSVVAQVAELQKLDLAGLKERWKWLFGTEPPAYSRQFMAKRLACRVQEIAYGGLSEGTSLKLRTVLAGAGLDEDGRAKSRNHKVRGKGLVPGTRLVRDWQGRRCEVTVARGGFEFEGRTYKSLSAIARSITGTRWNGPLFFGLRKDVAS